MSKSRSISLAHNKVDIIGELPLYMTGDILDKMDTKSLSRLCASSKKIRDVCFNDYHQGKYLKRIRNYKIANKTYNKYMDKRFSTAEQLEQVLKSIYKHKDRVMILNEIIDKIYNDSFLIFNSACEHNKLDVMKYVRDTFPSKEYDLSIGLNYAVSEGNFEAMYLIKEWADEDEEKLDYKEAIENAATGGQIQALKLLRKWNGKKFSNDSIGYAIDNASQENHHKTVKFLKKWLK